MKMVRMAPLQTEIGPKIAITPTSYKGLSSPLGPSVPGRSPRVPRGFVIVTPKKLSGDFLYTLQPRAPRALETQSMGHSLEHPPLSGTYLMTLPGTLGPEGLERPL